MARKAKKSKKTVKTKKEDLKSSLVRTRKIIAEKFRKLHANRMQNEGKMKKMYGTLSESLKKIISDKEKIQQRNDAKETVVQIHSPLNENDSSSESENESQANAQFEPEFDEIPKNDPLIAPEREKTEIQKDGIGKLKPMKLKDYKTVIMKRKKRKLHKNDEFMNIKTKMRKDIDDVEEMDVEDGSIVRKKLKTQMKRKPVKYSETAPGKQAQGSTQDVIFDEMNDILSKKRKRKSVSKNAVSSKFIKKQSAVQKKKENRRDQMMNTRKFGRNVKFDALRKEEEPQMISISPEDFNDDAEYIVPGVKRSRVNVPVKSIKTAIQKMKARKKNLSKKKGNGLERKFIPYSENIVYEYYDDPNELCDRLRLLTSSKNAGNTNHDQEINSIIEELRERDIIV